MKYITETRLSKDYSCLYQNISSIESNPEKWIKSIAEVSTEDLYDRTLELQVEVTQDEVMKYLVNDPSWEKSQNALDLGCGPGHLFTVLTNYFPKKKYTGIDLNPTFINFAKSYFKDSKISWIQHDIYDFKPKSKFDYVHVRALLQHLPSIPKFLDTLENMVQNRGTVLFLDAAGNESKNVDFLPALPYYQKMFSELANKQRAKGGNRNCLQDMLNIVSEYKFKVLDEKEFFACSTRDSLSDTYFLFTFFVCELLERIYEIKSDRSVYIRELIRWHNHNPNYAQFHGKWVKLEKI